MHSSSSNLSGVLLAAHPALLDPNFNRAVVLISSHSEEDGAVGAIVNRPLGRTLSDFDSAFAFGPLAKVPLYRGGPVGGDELIFAGWKWAPEEATFRLAFGIAPEQATDLLDDAGYEIRAFLGYAGWGQGQLEEEMAHRSWLLSSFDCSRLRGSQGQELWREIVGGVSAEMRVLAESPEDPSVN